MRTLLLVLAFTLLVPVQCLAAMQVAPNWATWDGKPVGSSTGAVTSVNGSALGTAAGRLSSWNGLLLPATSPSGTFSETFSTGSVSCWAGGPAACTQTWGNYSGTPTTQTLVTAPGSGWNHPKVVKLPATSRNPLYLYSIGTIPYATAGTLKGDVTVEFSYDASRFNSQAILLLNANTDGSATYSLNLDGAGNCLMGRTQWIPCAVNQRHLFHVHLDGKSSYDQLDGGTQYPFTADATQPFDEVALNGSTGTGLYFGDINVTFAGYNSCLASPQLIFDGLGGSGTITGANLTAGTHGGNFNTGWELQSASGLSFSYVSGGSPFAHPISVCGTSYAGNTGKAMRMTMPASNGSGGYWELWNFTTYVGYSVGFGWSYTSTGLNDIVDLFAIGDVNGPITNVQLNIVGSAQRICFENDVNDTLGSPCIPVDVAPSTPYWISFGTSATGDDSVYLYSYPNMTLLGSAHILPNARPAQVGVAALKMGKTGSEPISHSMTMDYWNVIMDFTGGRVPLLPQ
ncbi:MAG: hypothetical protein JST28_24090 [Acidobacteria bacterium]|nr:hypothetical protein [Acidobacteriota bacterium]